MTYLELKSRARSVTADVCTCSFTIIVQDDDAINAEIFIKKASFLVNNCKDEALNLQYKVCYGVLFLARAGCVNRNMVCILDCEYEQNKCNVSVVVDRCATLVFWIRSASFWRLHCVITNCHN